MSFIGGLFSGSRGVSWEPERAASPAQAQEQYRQVQQQLAQQRAFSQALQAQSPQAIQQQMMLGRELAGAVQGQVPSVAQTQLAETTAQNVARQQAMLGSQRGASGNVALLGRNIAQVGAQTQQEAARQAATLRAQEQLAARQQLADLSGQQLGQISGAQQLGAQSTLQAQQNILNAIAQANAARAGVAQQTAAGQGRIVGGIFEGLAGMGGRAAGFAKGGEVKPYANGGGIGSDAYWSRLQNDLGMMAPSASISTEGLGQAGQKMGSTLRGLMSSKPQRSPMGSEMQDYTSLASGGEVPAMVSPGEKYLPPEEVKKVAQGQKEPHQAGVKIPGQAKVKGDSLKNDTVPMTLEEGGIVIPRSVMQSQNPEEQARKFVAAVLAKKQQKRK